MMDRNTANIALATILTTVADVGPSPESPLYIGLMEKLRIDIHDWTLLMALLKSGGLATISGHVITLTEAGGKMAASIDAHLKNKGLGAWRPPAAVPGEKIRLMTKLLWNVPWPIVKMTPVRIGQRMVISVQLLNKHLYHEWGLGGRLRGFGGLGVGKRLWAVFTTEPDQPRPDMTRFRFETEAQAQAFADKANDEVDAQGYELFYSVGRADSDPRN